MRAGPDEAKHVPILDVEMIVREHEALSGGVAVKLADAAAEICGSKASELWVRVRTLPVENYAECGDRRRSFDEE